MNTLPTSMYLDPDQLRDLRIRAFLWHKNGFPGGDQELFPIFRSLLRLKHAVPIWSCAGHEDRGRFYLMFGTDEQGFYQLLRLLASIRQALSHAGPSSGTRVYNLDLRLSTSMWPIRNARENEHYPMALLEYNYVGSQEHLSLLACVQQEILAFVERERERKPNNDNQTYSIGEPA